MDSNWEQIALWLADCEAATAYDYDRKSASKNDRRRHIHICESAVTMLKARDLIGRIPTNPERVIARLESVVEHLKKIV